MIMRDKAFRVQGSGERSSFFVLRSLLLIFGGRAASPAAILYAPFDHQADAEARVPPVRPISRVAHPASPVSPLPPVPTKNQERRTRNGLTLIELLSSFAILAIIVALLGVTLNTATDNWHDAQARTRVVAQARAVMDTIAQDLRQAVATTNFPITIENAPATYGATNNAIQFIRIISAAGTNQYAIKAVRYSVLSSNSTPQFVRWTHPLVVDPPENPPDNLPGTMDDDHSPFAGSSPLTLADGLAALRFSPPADTNSIVQAGAPVWPYIDIYFELLGADDCRTAAGLSETIQTAFVERHVLRFSQRVYLPAANRWNLP